MEVLGEQSLEDGLQNIPPQRVMTLTSTFHLLSLPHLPFMFSSVDQIVTSTFFLPFMPCVSSAYLVSRLCTT